MFTCMSICSQCTTSLSSAGQKEKGEKEGSKEGHFPCPKNSLWAVVHNEGRRVRDTSSGTWSRGEQSANAWVQNWMLLYWGSGPQLSSYYGLCMKCKPGHWLYGESCHPGSAFQPHTTSTPGSIDEAAQSWRWVARRPNWPSQWEGLNISVFAVSCYLGSIHCTWGALPFKLEGPNLSNSGKAKEMRQDE